MTEDWTKWESLVVNGAYPLRRFLARSDHSVVFLTEYTRNTAADAAIKLIPANPASDDAQLAHWNAAVALSHPHLIRLFDAGRCQLGGHPFLFVVMEYAQQTLAQILPGRALTLGEVRELLPPTLDALAFLHGRNLVHYRLKPPNILVVNDQLKLASDGVRPADAKDSKASPAGDIWALGATLVEALTQHPPDASGQAIPLPDTLPPAFADTLRRSLSSNPADRPAVADLDAQFKGAPPIPTLAKSAPLVPAVQAAAAAPAVAPQTLPRKRFIVPASVAVAVLALLALAWAASHLLRGQPKAPQPATNSAPSVTPSAAPAATPAASAPATEAPAPAGPAPDSVVHQEIPAVSPRARASIRGTIKVTVRVTVDRSGKVVAQAVENRGSSKYFARVAGEAAKKWQFAPGSEESRQWLLQFEFNRSATAAHATRHIL